MRRKDREITEIEALKAIIRRCQVCRIGLNVPGEAPYIVPMNFGYLMEGGTLTLYFHCARQGRKLALLAKNPRAAFEMDGAHRFLPGETASDATFAYESIIGEGVLEQVEDPAEKRRGLDLLMEHYTGQPTHEYTENCLATVTILRLKSSSFTGKCHPLPLE